MKIINTRASLQTTHLEQADPDQWFYWEENHLTSRNPFGADAKTIIRIKPDDFLPPDAIIKSCKFHFIVHSMANAPIATVHEMTIDDINMPTASWNSKETGIAWSNPGAVGDYNPNPFNSIQISSGWKNIDISQAAIESMENNLQKFVLLWIDTLETFTQSFAFRGEKYLANESERPYLEIKYTQGIIVKSTTIKSAVVKTI